MTVENLASVFAPNILRQADYDPDVEMSVTPVITLTIAGFIRRHEELFRYELTHFAQLRCAALASTVAGAVGPAAVATPLVLLQQNRQNYSEPPPESAAGSTTSVHSSLYKSGSLTDPSNSQSQSQIWFSHGSRHACTLSRQSTITGVSPNRRLNGRTASADRDSSSSEFQDSLQVPKTSSSSPASNNCVLGASEAALETVAEQLRHWRSVALVARAEAVCERAKSRALTAELARARCDLNMAETELGLLRKRLSLLESALAASRSGGFGAGGGVAPSASVPRNLR
ncbi:unnamed protein product [Taenia asiatica]|uniref:Rho-GAP domain-containing protein n=1 Tax=Taenia asiatica TaxID=60517 RepID=A0A0R3W6F3_TAEAS|nr:unnamed protein product [Taenia asiatica]